MLKSLKCRFAGHLYVDSRSQPGTKVCIRCRHREPFEGLTRPSSDKAEDDVSGQPATPSH